MKSAFELRRNNFFIIIKIKIRFYINGKYITILMLHKRWSTFFSVTNLNINCPSNLFGFNF